MIIIKSIEDGKQKTRRFDLSRNDEKNIIPILSALEDLNNREIND